MSAFTLLAEVASAFQSEPYPGNEHIVHDNSDYDLEALGIKESFRVYTWQTLSDSLMLYEQSCLGFLSRHGFKYYLPSFLQFAVRSYAEAAMIPDNIILSLTLPTEVDVTLSAYRVKLYQLDKDMPKVDWNDIHQNRLQHLNEEVHRFITHASQFNPAQGRAILHFLEYMRDEYGGDFFNNEPQVAIERYWFQFA
jgi:hypothetical protein